MAGAGLKAAASLSSASSIKLRRCGVPATLLGVAGLLLYGVGRAPCVLALVFHQPCPSCGLTRAARFAAHGSFAEATNAHPLWLLMIPLAAWAFGYEMYKYIETGRFGAVERMRYAKPITTAVVALLIAVWIARFLGAFGGPASV